MIVRYRKKPIPLAKTEAVIPRLPPYFKRRKELEKEAAKRRKGFKGEQKVDRYVKKYLAKKYTILHDVSLKLNGYLHQIDTLILTSHMIFLLEIKILRKLSHLIPTLIN